MVLLCNNFTACLPIMHVIIGGHRDACEVNQLSLSCDRGGFAPEGRGSGPSPSHTGSSYKLIHSNNNPCPHLLQHALQAFAINQRIPSAPSCEGRRFCALRVAIVILCNWQACLNPVSDASPTLDNKHVGFLECEIHAKMTGMFRDDGGYSFG